MNAIPSESREELEKLERRHAENPEGRYFVPLANAYRRVGEIERAITLLREGLGRHPDYLSAHIVMGRCLVDRGDPEAAADEFRFVLDLDPQNLIALRTLGEIALEGGRGDEAARWFQELLGVDPMNEDARRALDSLSVAGRTEAPAVTEDVAAAEEEPLAAGPVAAAEEDPHRFRDARARAGLVDERGDLEDQEVDADFSFGDSEVVVTETIAELYTRQSFFGRAAEVYRELIRQRGEDPRLRERLERVEAMERGDSPEQKPAPPADVPDESPTQESSPVGVSGEDGPPAPSVEAGDRSADADLHFDTSSWGDSEPLTASGSLRSEEETSSSSVDENWARALDGGEEGTPESLDAEPLPTLADSRPLPSLHADSFASSFEDVFGEAGADDHVLVDRAVDENVGGDASAAPADEATVAAVTAAPEAGSATIRDFLRGVTAWRPSPRGGAESGDDASSGARAGAAPVEGVRSATSADAETESWRMSGSAWDDLQEAPPSERPVEDDPVSFDHGASDLSDLPPLGPGDVAPGTFGEVEEPFPWEFGGKSPLVGADPDSDAITSAIHDDEGTTPDDSAYDGSRRHRDELPPATASEDRAPVTREPPPTGGSGNGLELDDDLESFQAWLRSLKR